MTVSVLHVHLLWPLVLLLAVMLGVMVLHMMQQLGCHVLSVSIVTGMLMCG